MLSTHLHLATSLRINEVTILLSPLRLRCVESYKFAFQILAHILFVFFFHAHTYIVQVTSKN